MEHRNAHWQWWTDLGTTVGLDHFDLADEANEALKDTLLRDETVCYHLEAESVFVGYPFGIRALTEDEIARIEAHVATLGAL